MPVGVLGNITTPYSAIEARLYEHLLAEAVMELVTPLKEEFSEVVPKGGRLLDVGCGGGHLLLDIQRVRPDINAVGLDCSATQIHCARKRAKPDSENPQFKQGSVMNLPFSDCSFDAVVSIFSLKHWPNRGLGLFECVRVLRPQGHLMVIEVDRGCHLFEARDFVSLWKIPWFTKWAATAMFRTWVSGQSIDMDDARRLMKSLHLIQSEISNVEGTPALLMKGIRPAV
jgi:ubiquinone/menaquinone biosynthesis C-methylase UbiE